jgi:HTH-type transcriptional regulator/antitoxin HigA
VHVISYKAIREFKAARPDLGPALDKSILIEEYDRKHYPLAPAHPHKTLAFLFEQRGLEPHDLWPVLGSKSRVSEILSGKRAISKAHAKKLAAFFHVPIDLLI